VTDEIADMANYVTLKIIKNNLIKPRQHLFLLFFSFLFFLSLFSFLSPLSSLLSSSSSPDFFSLSL
jgi:hypothetical protein